MVRLLKSPCSRAGAFPRFADATPVRALAAANARRPSPWPTGATPIG